MSIVSSPAAASPSTAGDGSLENPTSCSPSAPCRTPSAVCSSTAWKPLSVEANSVSSATWSRLPRPPRSPNVCARCGRAPSSSTPSRPSAAPSAYWPISPATRIARRSPIRDLSPSMTIRWRSPIRIIAAAAAAASCGLPRTSSSVAFSSTSCPTASIASVICGRPLGKWFSTL